MTVRARLCLLAALGLPLPALAQTAPAPDADIQTDSVAAQHASKLPDTSTTEHTLVLPGRTLHFTAIAGSITLRDDNGKPEAQIATIAYMLDGADPTTRPVTFIFNGGPGEASGWLQLGNVGPWRIPMYQPDDTQDGVPSSQPQLLPNPDTWLDFTDLVFIDPAGTGYSRIVSTDASVQKRLWSVDGDIESLAEVVRRWLEKTSRVQSPKFILGESYGDFRAPRLAYTLATDQGVGVRGLIMISPVLDFGGSQIFDPLYTAEYLPTLAAVARAKHGPVTRADLADVEAYASGDYLHDSLAGPRDVTALHRMVDRIVSLTGLDSAVVLHEVGNFNEHAFLCQSQPGQVINAYDATITSPSAYPENPNACGPAPFDRLTAPFTSSMLLLYTQQLRWHPTTLYHLYSGKISRNWDWGTAFDPPESVTALREDLALDPQFRVLIGHGLFDFETPYFKTVLLLQNLPDIGPPGRVTLDTFEGGHMFYSRDASRASFRADAQKLIAGP